MNFPRVLAGVRIVDLTTGLAGAYATMLLADLGADVIMIHDSSRLDGEVARHGSLHRNKRSVTLDLATDEGRDWLVGLVKRSHALVVDLPPAVAASRGLDFDAVVARAPDVIYCSVTDCGATGSGRNLTLGEFGVQAVSGMMHLTGDTDSGPVATGVPFASISSGAFTALALLAYLREPMGSGRFIDTSAVDSAVSMLTYMGAMTLNTDEVMSRVGSGQGSIYPYNAFEASDGYIVVAPITNEFWRRFCRAIDMPKLGDDERFSRLTGRLQNRASLEPILDEVLRQRPVREWAAAFEREDVPHGAVNSVKAALDLPQTQHRSLIVRCASADPDRLIEVLGTPFRFSFPDDAVPQFAFQAPPLPGEHTSEVLAGLLVAAPAQPRSSGDTGTRASSNGDGPLRGIRVVDFGRMFSGPMCTQLLADLGADVTKVETPKVGDATRHNLPMVRGESTYFLSVNRGKSSYTLDLKDPLSREEILQLVAEADVVVENFRPGVMERLGLSYHDLSSVNDSLIMCSISGFGATGPLSGRTSFDLVNQALAGFVDLTAGHGQRPVRMELPVSDLAGGMYAAVAVVAALKARDKFGLGCSIDLSLHDILISQLGFLGSVDEIELGDAADEPAVGRAGRTIATFDGFVAVDNRDAPDQAVVVTPDLEQRVAAQTTSAALDHLRDAGVSCCPVRSVPEVLTSDVALERQLIVEYPHPQDGGTIRLVSSPFLVDGRRVVSRKGPPSLSQVASA